MLLKHLPTALIFLLLASGCRDETAIQALAIDDAITHLNEAGTISAANTVTVNGPSWGGSQRITWIMAEGTQVAAGDTIIRFDTTEFDDYIKQSADELESLRMAVTSVQAQGSANNTRTENSIAKARLAKEMAGLDLESRQYESRTLKEQAELDGQQAEIDLQQALHGRLAQATLDSLEIAQAALKAAKQDARVRRLQTYLHMLTATAPSAGMVVLVRQYTEEGVKSYRAGDEVQSQAPVLEITDTSAMKVQFSVHEKDRWRLHPGQVVSVILDAYKDTAFPGIVESVGSLPSTLVEGSVARRFEATAAIEENDLRLKPGMSARVIIELGGTP